MIFVKTFGECNCLINKPVGVKASSVVTQLMLDLKVAQEENAKLREEISILKDQLATSQA